MKEKTKHFLEKNIIFFVLFLGIGLGFLIANTFVFSDCRADFRMYPENDDEIIYLIDSANEKIYVEMYVFSNEEIRDAIIRASDRGIDVRIILEKSIAQNTETYNNLKSNGVDVRWSGGYSLNHAKLVIIDKLVILGSPNFSWSAFHKNREHAVLLKCDTHPLEKEFLKDWLLSG
ncbi:hypothetical protein KO465_01190 [Candidatus Micrarchaeota archaeon]|jgi:phosphatidylserine/phosphatidylglycerophosphate/cardiolipin synthase-like enzyme|nr:hypothetical protein [Candidatus Micrarchaeota archaeon]